ncbi:hypothetical protein C8R44DRAFT_858261 [Mycena epipterygia]|nr:hypothetical protein C8R44DRAFT_858261 [Mycena epipterygia]
MVKQLPALAATTLAVVYGVTLVLAQNDTLNLGASAARKDCYPGNQAGNQTLGFNTGISLSPADTTLLVAFGDSWSANGMSNGSKPDAPLYIPSDGYLIQTGTERMTNGYTWIEWLSMYSSIPLQDYAVPGAVIDRSLYSNASNASDFGQQVDLFTSQKIKFSANTTVFTIFLGSEDLTYGVTSLFSWQNVQLITSEPGGNLRSSVTHLLANVKSKLIDPIGARNFLFIGPSEWTDLQDNNYVEQLTQFQHQTSNASIQFAYVNLVRLYTQVNANLTSYGFTETGPCVVQDNRNCTDPDSRPTFVKTFPSGSTRETAAACTKYPGGVEPNCPGNKFNRSIAYVDITAHDRGCNPYPDLSQLPLQNYAWEGKIKILLGLAVPPDTWNALYNNTAGFLNETNKWDKLVAGFDFLCDNPDADISGPSQCPPAGFDKFISAVRKGSTIPNLTISVSNTGVAPYPDYDPILSVVDFVNLFTVGFSRPGTSNVFRPHSSIRDISAFSQNIGYSRMKQFNLVQSYMGRVYALNNSVCSGYGCTTFGAGITNQTDECGLNGELPYGSILFEQAQFQAQYVIISSVVPGFITGLQTREVYDDFSWTKYMILGEQAAVSYDDPGTLDMKQNWAQQSCFGGQGIWGVDDAIPSDGQHSGSADDIVGTGNLTRRADAHWANWKDTGKCQDYGREIETAQLMDIKGSWDTACKNTPVYDFAGRAIYAVVCFIPEAFMVKDSDAGNRNARIRFNKVSSDWIFGGEIGTFYMPMRNTDTVGIHKCRPTWGDLTDKHVNTPPTTNAGLILRVVDARATPNENMPNYMESQPASGLGVHFDKPTTCYNGWTGEFGYFRVTDETCAGQWSKEVEVGCLGTQKPGFKRYNATLEIISKMRFVPLVFSTAGIKFSNMQTSCVSSGSSALASIFAAEIQARLILRLLNSQGGIPVCPDGLVWDYAINGNSKVQGYFLILLQAQGLIFTQDAGTVTTTQATRVSPFSETLPGPDHNYPIEQSRLLIERVKSRSIMSSLTERDLAQCNIPQTNISRMWPCKSRPDAGSGEGPTPSVPVKRVAGCNVPAFHMPLPTIPGLPVINNYLDEGPTAADIVNRESFRLAFDSAWHQSFFPNGTAREVGGWLLTSIHDEIYRPNASRADPDQNNDVYRIVYADPGRSGIPFPQLGNTGGNPAIDLTLPGTWPRESPPDTSSSLTVGPSQGGNPQPSFADHRNAWLRGVPGIVVSRDGLYGYGPSQRENRMRSGPRDYPNSGEQYGGQNARRIGGSWRPSRSPDQREP